MSAKLKTNQSQVPRAHYMVHAKPRILICYRMFCSRTPNLWLEALFPNLFPRRSPIHTTRKDGRGAEALWNKLLESLLHESLLHESLLHENLLHDNLLQGNFLMVASYRTASCIITSYRITSYEITGFLLT